MKGVKMQSPGPYSGALDSVDSGRMSLLKLLQENGWASH